MSKGFQFKRFFIQHDKCAMKVNTDGILLGAIAHIQNCKQILDLGTGTGLVALMLAQRSEDDCIITGLELEPKAYLQAVENAQNSAWAHRINIVHGDVMTQYFAPQFQLIVSNPPYFEDSLSAKTQERELARAVTLYSHLDWLKQAQHWLLREGRITMILPTEMAEKLISQSHSVGLHCIEQWKIFTKAGKVAKRMIVSFSSQEAKCEEKQLVIYDEDNAYTESFKQLTKAFYLNF